MKCLVPLISVAILISGCNGEPHEYTRIEAKKECQANTIEKRHEFILQCINNANPHSDEEPEDWINNCEDMAENLYCPILTYRITYWSADGEERHWDPEIDRKSFSME